MKKKISAKARKSINKSDKRFYAFNFNSLSSKKLIQESSNCIKKNGFCIIDNVIPSKLVKTIRQEIIDAQNESSKNVKLIKQILDKNKKFPKKN